MIIKGINEIPWEKTNYGKRKTILSLDLEIPLILRYVVVEGEVEKHSHPNGEVIFVLRGEGIIQFKEGEKPIKPGDTIIIPPNIIQGIKRTSKEDLEMIAILPEKKA